MPELFADELFAATYQLLGRCDNLHQVIESGGPEVGELVQRLSVDESKADPSDVAALLWKPYLERLMADAKLALASAGPDRQVELVQEHTWLRLRLEDIGEPARQAGAIAELLAWMGEPPKDRQ